MSNDQNDPETNSASTISKLKRSGNLVTSVEDKVARTFPWLKTSLGGLWAIFWIIIAFTVEAIFILFPILLAILGIVFIIALLVMSDGALDLALFSGGSSKKKEK